MAESKHDILFNRLLLMLQKLSHEGEATVRELADEYGCSEKTIERDIKRLHFFPIEYEKGVVRISEGYDLDRSGLENSELLFAELAFSSIEGLNEESTKRIHSIRAKLSHPLFFTPYQIKAEGYESIDMDSQLLNKIEDAILKKNIATITSNDNTSKIEPYKVVSFDGIWYLFAKDLTDNKIKTFLIAQIQEFRAELDRHEHDVESINKMLDNVHTAWFEDGNSFSVTVKIKSEIAHYFKLKKHLPSQKTIKEKSDGTLIISFDVSSDEDVDNLIKAWMPHIEVLKPERFRRRLISELESYLDALKSIELEM